MLLQSLSQQQPPTVADPNAMDISHHMERMLQAASLERAKLASPSSGSGRSTPPQDHNGNAGHGKAPPPFNFPAFPFPPGLFGSPQAAQAALNLSHLAVPQRPSSPKTNQRLSSPTTSDRADRSSPAGSKDEEPQDEGR